MLAFKRRRPVLTRLKQRSSFPSLTARRSTAGKARASSCRLPTGRSLARPQPKTPLTATPSSSGGRANSMTSSSGFPTASPVATAVFSIAAATLATLSLAAIRRTSILAPPTLASTTRSEAGAFSSPVERGSRSLPTARRPKAKRSERATRCRPPSSRAIGTTTGLSRRGRGCGTTSTGS